MTDKKIPFRYSTPQKPKSIILFKNTYTNMDINNIDVCEQINKALDMYDNSSIEILTDNHKDFTILEEDNSKSKTGLPEENNNMCIKQLENDNIFNDKYENNTDLKDDNTKSENLSNISIDKTLSKEMLSFEASIEIPENQIVHIENEYVSKHSAYSSNNTNSIISKDQVKTPETSTTNKLFNDKHLDKLIGYITKIYNNVLNKLESYKQKNTKLKTANNEYKELATNNRHLVCQLQTENKVLKDNILLFQDYKEEIGICISNFKENIDRIIEEKKLIFAKYQNTIQALLQCKRTLKYNLECLENVFCNLDLEKILFEMITRYTLHIEDCIKDIRNIKSEYKKTYTKLNIKINKLKRKIRKYKKVRKKLSFTEITINVMPTYEEKTIDNWKTKHINNPKSISLQAYEKYMKYFRLSRYNSKTRIYKNIAPGKYLREVNNQIPENEKLKKSNDDLFNKAITQKSNHTDVSEDNAKVTENSLKKSSPSESDLWECFRS